MRIPFLPLAPIFSFSFLFLFFLRLIRDGMEWKMRNPYLDVQSLVMSALATTVSDVILRQLHTDQILHHQLRVVMVVVVVLVVVIVVVGGVVVVDQSSIFGRK